MVNKNLYFLTSPQKSIWTMEKFFEGTNINNICATVTVQENIQEDIFKEAIQNVVKNNDAFRIRILIENNTPVQYISDYKPFEIEVVNIKDDDEMENLKDDLINQKFELIDSDLFCFKILKYKDGHITLLFSVHHLIGDSWSLGLFVKAVMKEYNNLIIDSKSDSNPTSYLDYMEAENTYKASNRYKNDKIYWEKKFESVPDNVTFPSYNIQKNIFSYNSKRESFRVNFDIAQNIKYFCVKNKISIFNFFMAVYSIYLKRISGLDEFVIGTPILNRTNFQEKQTMGMFVNTIPVKIDFSNCNSFIEFTNNLSINLLNDFKHQKYSYTQILEDLREKNSQISGLFNVSISYQITKVYDKEYGNYTSKWHHNNISSNDFTIHITDLNDTGELYIDYDYLTEKYDLKDIYDLHERIEFLISQILENENTLIKDFDIVLYKEKRKILNEFNDTKTSYPRSKNFLSLFEEQVNEKADNTAVIFEGKELTYKELGKKSNNIANNLYQYNITTNDVIAILLDRSFELIEAIFGVIKTGASFVLIDTSLPEERIHYILNDSRAKLCISSENIDDLLKETEEINNSITIKNNLCVIYTSGSTGKPKGVLLHKSGYYNLINAFETDFNISQYKRTLSIATISFDMFAFEVFSCLLFGNTLVLANYEEQKNPIAMSDLIKNYGVEFFVTTPSRAELLLLEECNNPLKDVKAILFGGEKFTNSLLNRLRKVTHAKIFNSFGPTEITSACTNKLITSDEITIGKPLPNTEVYICDSNLKLLPIGVVGEICVGGKGVSNGYLNKPDITKKQFSENPFKEGFIYKTGDLGRYRLDGELEYIERLDNQVKIRGLRIELGEIEERILETSLVNACTVKKFEKNNREFLCAYFTSNNQVTGSEIRKNIAKNLPNYMIPSYFVQLKELPYNANGKIDRKKLPEPKIDDKKRNIILPKKEIDKKIINILKEILNTNTISLDDSFFDLGGDSLLAINFVIRLKSEFNIQILVKDILEKNTIQDICDLVSSKNSNEDFDSFDVTLENDNSQNLIQIPKAEYYPTSSAQKRIYFASQIADSTSTLYNSPGGLIFNGIIDELRLEKCFNELIKRHESLRTYFELVNNELVQKIKENIDFKLDVIDKADMQELFKIFEEFIKPFDLSSAPLFRAKFVKLANSQSCLLLDIHHIITDGTSMSIFLNELCKLYNNEKLPKLEITYKDFADFENRTSQNNFKEAENYWLEQFKGEVPVLDLPTNYPRPTKLSYEGSKVYSYIDENLTNKINVICNKFGITPYMLLLSCYYILLSKYSSQDEIVVGSPIVGRTLAPTYNIIGMFVNTLALKNIVDKDLSFIDFVKNIKENLLKAYEYQTYPFEELVNKLNIKRDASRNPLFDTMFIYQNKGYEKINFGNIEAQYFIPDNKVSKFDLSLEVIPVENKLNLNFEYATKLFNKEFIENLSSHYINILNNVIANINIRISDITILSEVEKNKILFEFNNRKKDYPINKNIIELFEEQAEKTPETIAVCFENQKITYEELNEKANCLANFLRNNEVTNEDTIAILLNRSINLIVSILATIKVGSTYVIIDNNLPENRINYILENSQAKCCLVNSKTSNILKDFDKKLNIEKFNSSIYENINFKVIPNNNLSIIYTSGSTGNPKGVLLHQKGFINLIYSFKDEMMLSECKNILGIATVSFDMFAVEMFSSLLLGNTLFLANEEEQKNPIAMSNLIINNNIDFLVTTPSRIELLLKPECNNPLKNIKVMQLGGEKFTDTLWNKLSKVTTAKIFNGYGPTEITACCTNKLVTSSDITIGNSLPNVSVYICDSQAHLLPIGIPGEICIGGIGVSNGYLNNEEETNKRFVKNPYGTNFIYRTGDLGRLRENGEIEYINRLDNQVKMRGLRIELGEIETLILKYPNIKNAIVVKQNANNREFLSAYFVADKKINVAELRKHLSNQLPNYMVPSYYTALDEFKFTPNGKVDRKSLPLPTGATNIVSEGYVSPQTELQRELVNIWESILNTKPIGVNDNFFELGGDSLLAMTLNMELLKITSKIKYSDIFQYPTIAELEEKINSNENKSAFTKIENLPENYQDILNNSIDKVKISEYKPNGILLTGATGFLGAHILDEFIKDSESKIYCIIRKQPGVTTTTKLLQKLNYYFGNKYDSLINDRIFAISGEIAEENFCLSEKDLTKLANSVDLVINSAANVAHYGNYNEFYNSNVKTTKNIIDFCKKYNKKLYHISTTGVSGIELDLSYLRSKKDKKNIRKFGENSLYIGQVLNNVYARSKFEAESNILSAINDGLDAYILRMGNLMPRYTDGVFQENILNNAFITKFATFAKIGIIPTYMLKHSLNFTPVDYAAKAIYKLVTHPTNINRIFHILNNKNIYTEKYIKSLKEAGIEIKVLSESKFIDKINELINDEQLKNSLNNIINDFDNHLHLTYTSDIITISKFTTKYLKKIGFKWPRITMDYLKKFNDVLRRIL